MARLVICWTEPALEDLDRIADYIALDKPEAARHLVQRVMKRVEQLATSPESGSKPKELRGTAYRHLVIPPLRLFYRVTGNQILILHILRGERLFHLNDLTGRDR